MEDTISTVEVTSILWKVFNTLEDSISTCGDNKSTVGVNTSTVEGIQYSGGYIQYRRRLASILWGITSVLLRLISTMEIKI